jgi:hypothetical protein
MSTRRAKFWENKIRDFNEVKYIKVMANSLLVKDDEMKNRWKKYFDKLFNDES